MSKAKRSRNGKGQFVKGASGNPTGRPKGSRNRTTLLLEALREGHLEELTQKAVDLGRDGNPAMLKLLLPLLYPRPKQRPISLSLPEVNCLEDLALVRREIFAAATNGTITLEEAEQLERRLPSLTEAVLIEGTIRNQGSLSEMIPFFFSQPAQIEGKTSDEQ